MRVGGITNEKTKRIAIGQNTLPVINVLKRGLTFNRDNHESGSTIDVSFNFWVQTKVVRRIGNDSVVVECFYSSRLSSSNYNLSVFWYPHFVHVNEVIDIGIVLLMNIQSPVEDTMFCPFTISWYRSAPPP